MIAPSIWGKHVPACDNAPTDPTHRPKRDERHDAYFCPACDAWIEGQCSDPKCSFCQTRPSRPSECAPDRT